MEEDNQQNFDVSVEQVANSWPVLAGSQELGILGLANNRFNGPTSTKFIKLFKIIQPEYEEFQKQRIALCERLGKKNDTTNVYDIDEERKEEFDNEFRELLNAKISIPNDLKISADSLRTPLNLKEAMELKATSIEVAITPAELDLLSWLIVN